MDNKKATMSKEPRLRLIDINNLEEEKYEDAAPIEYKNGFNDAILLLIGELSSPEKTREIIGKSFTAGRNYERTNGQTEDKQEFINSLIKE